ncbi:MAG: Transglycosylase, Slt family [Cytophagales bacterium]|nr:transporter substrate-binding domain-containing protein [Bacteroidota bacterium]MBS1979850.1 transporter substrate-binding domain-containing protein [Bacteroidota bacterium]WHZ07136.1 MAG: Transglycosylase, Slt family [Cytophagales bacterium]
MAGRILCILFLVSCISCHKKTREITFSPQPLLQRDLKDIQKRGYLEAIIDNNSVSYFIYKGRTMGFEYELLQRLASAMHVDLKIQVIAGIDEALDKLNKGEGDIVAFPLTLTQEREQYLSFSNALFQTQQVLVQKKPPHWRMLPSDIVEKKLLRNPVDLIGKEVHVKNGSAFIDRLENLSAETGGEIIIHEDSADAETESLIQKVALGEIQYTVADQMIAHVNELYFPNLDINTLISLPQQIGWAMRKNSPELLATVNQWLAEVKKQGIFQVIYDRYFNSPRFLVTMMSPDFTSLKSNHLSPYDEQLKKGATQLGWDWRLLASLVFQESNFNPRVESWAGAIGLMQVMPETGQHFGITNLWDPNQNILVGVRFLKFLDDYWKKTVMDDRVRIKFILASYNVGLTHVIDAQKLAKKYGKKTDAWEDNVGFYLTQKSNPKYYRDAVVSAGYCRCDGPVIYVKQVLQRYEEYKIRINA